MARGSNLCGIANEVIVEAIAILDVVLIKHLIFSALGGLSINCNMARFCGGIKS